MNKINTISYISLLILITATSCIRSIFCVRGDGIMQTEIRRVSDFSEIENSTAFDVIYRKADTFGIRIDAEQNIMNYIETNVYDNCLEISVSPATICIDYTERPLITVSSPFLTKIFNTGSGEFIGDEISGEALEVKNSGSGDITVENANGDDIKIVNSGSGNIELQMSVCINLDCQITGSGDFSSAGYCEESSLKISGSGNIYSASMICNETSVIITGTGNVYTTTTDYLNALISGTGNIFLRGNPDIDQTITGTGRIISYK